MSKNDLRSISSNYYMGIKAGIAGNLIIFLVIAIAAYLNSNNYELYYTSLQEDRLLEWASFWSFFLAGIIFSLFSIEEYKNGTKLPWFSAGLAVFCFLFAFEEISWGQRLFGYRPPEYFLANNYQQEFNFHNVIEKDMRKLILRIIILGYGVIIPVLALIPYIRSIFKRMGVISPPIILLPAFIATFMLYKTYPWKFSGELVELMLGFGFLFSSILLTNFKHKSGFLGKYQVWLQVLIITFIVILFGLINSAISSTFRDDNPTIIAAAEKESEALYKDFVALASGKYGFPASKCGFHVRVYTYFEKYDRRKKLESGFFSKLKAQGLSEERADFFLDPWNSPYWLRDKCLKDGSRVIGVYSFGPDRRRQSLEKEILGDDIGKLFIFKNTRRR